MGLPSVKKRRTAEAILSPRPGLRGSDVRVGVGYGRATFFGGIFKSSGAAVESAIASRS